MADALVELAWKLLKVASAPEKAEKASLSQVMVAIGISIDKAQLLKSLPTKISATGVIGDNMDLSRLNDRQLAVLEELLALARGDQANGANGVNGSTHPIPPARHQVILQDVNGDGFLAPASSSEVEQQDERTGDDTVSPERGVPFGADDPPKNSHPDSFDGI
jgi:hypothetical protein